MRPPEQPQSPRSAFVIDQAASALLIEARSTVGPIGLATASLTGTAAVAVTASGLAVRPTPTAAIELPVESLSSGNAFYDAEVHRRLDSRRFPTIRAELRGARPLDADRWMLEGDLTIHGTTRSLSGSADIQLVDHDRLRLSGDQVVDIRDFAISLPTTLLLRIYPDVTVRFRIEAVREG